MASRSPSAPEVASSLSLDSSPLSTPFRCAVWELTSLIPAGRVATYGTIAHLLSCKSAQAVGTALHHNPFAPTVPCHRVLKTGTTAAGPSIGGFMGSAQSKGVNDTHIQKKLKLLQSEGVAFDSAFLHLADPKRVEMQWWEFPLSTVNAVRARQGLEALGREAGSDVGVTATAGTAGRSCADAGEEGVPPATIETAVAGVKRSRASKSAAAHTAAASVSAPAHPAASSESEVETRARLAASGSSGAAVRLACRTQLLSGHTSGLAPGYAQANLVILPQEHAFDFLLFCVRNPKPCPLLEVTNVGSPECVAIAPGSDIRTDLPRYRVYRHGVLSEECTDITHLWPLAIDRGASATATQPKRRKGESAVSTNGATVPSSEARTDWVGFLLGCSFSFEEALLDAGVPVRHLQESKGTSHADDVSAPAASVAGGSGEAGVGRKGAPGSAGTDDAIVKCSDPLVADAKNVPMYKTAIPTTPAGVFSGPLVVSMRPMTVPQSEVAAAVTGLYPRVHGRPIFAGEASAIGISDIHKPDYGDDVTIRPGEVPVFWACGVTPQAALLHAKLPLVITHAPGHMFVSDKLNKDLAGFPEIILPTA